MSDLLTQTQLRTNVISDSTQFGVDAKTLQNHAGAPCLGQERGGAGQLD